jgi:hypothetical protein
MYFEEMIEPTISIVKQVSFPETKSIWNPISPLNTNLPNTGKNR